MTNETDLKLNRAMYKRRVYDNHTCCNCGYHTNIPLLNREIHVHHCYDKSTYKRLKYKVKYMRTLCGNCHIDGFHVSWMGGTRVSCTMKNYIMWRAWEEVVCFAWLRRLIGKLFK